MTPDNHISELADRVERASGADREIDCRNARPALEEKPA